MSMTLIVIILYIIYNNEIGYIKTLVTSTTMSILATASAIGNEIIIIIANLYRA
jgi:hypothetical protein